MSASAGMARAEVVRTPSNRRGLVQSMVLE